MISGSTSRRTLRAIALLETAKGLLVLGAGFGLLSLLHQDVEMLATRLISYLHLNPGREYVGVFIHAASHVGDRELWFFAVLALVYSGFRLVEGCGLWWERAWAEWLALMSGTVYLPVEIYKLAEKFTWLRLSVLAMNILVVVLVALVLWRSMKMKATRSAHSSTP
jgi:uncharacterized membrane protein (DUF2068 family)